MQNIFHWLGIRQLRFPDGRVQITRKGKNKHYCINQRILFSSEESEPCFSPDDTYHSAEKMFSTVTTCKWENVMVVTLISNFFALCNPFEWPEGVTSFNLQAVNELGCIQMKFLLFFLKNIKNDKTLVSSKFAVTNNGLICGQKTTII